ncbi:hypothetical protein [Moorella sp. Hama-1]|uniref:hypothetical protein n=1 Tax=Moorella sp. Hama-1 TaxID=2138101 RepID=UPI000D655EAC|nr:hypothetical protein [Moorella sp. Hama-1]MDN5362501.1 hypothetical protein [Moorella sp. (in: firmicutes)]BCV22261.1 hypothetical protein hamaS1_23300 [Moorella sp. Hama-1]
MPEDPADKELKQLVDFMFGSELADDEQLQEVLQMAMRMPAEEREKIFQLLNTHPVSQEWGKRLAEMAKREGKNEGKLEGKLEGMLEETRAAILDYLSSRFSEYPADVVISLDTISDLEKLKRLRREIFKSNSLPETLALIARATNGARDN